MAPFVHKYKEEIKAEYKNLWLDIKKWKIKKEIDKKVYNYVKQSLQNFVFNINVPSRWWSQTPFVNITLDWTCPEDLKDKSLLLGWALKWFYPKKFGELQEEMDLINKVLIEVYTEWDASWAVFTFPIPTYNITEDFNWNWPNVEALFEMTAKYWIPYFQNFIGSQFKLEKDEQTGKIKKVPNPDAYTPWAVRSMCCRLQLDLKMLERRWWWLFGSAEMTGSVWVVTLNMARIWYNFKWDKDWFKKQVFHLMDLAKTSLEIKRKEMTKWLEAWLFPFTKRYLTAGFRNHFSTIWINWMNEAILNFTNGKEDISNPWWKEFAKEILDYMREILKIYQEETGNLYNLEATPAEWTTYRFAREDQRQMPRIIQSGTKEAPYYTNSSQLPVWFTDDPFTALEQQNELQCKYTWWTVLHMYMGERISSSKICRDFVKKVIENYQLPYITISPTFSICPIHGYIAWEHDFCPKCDEKIGYKWQKYDIETRGIYTDDDEKISLLEKQMV
jgi:ribonucleoside-triphosphate reductase